MIMRPDAQQGIFRAVLPHLRKQGRSLLIWVSSTSTRGGVAPWPYFAAKAAMDSLAVTSAGELSRWGIETSIVSPGAFTKGTNHTIARQIDMEWTPRSCSQQPPGPTTVTATASLVGVDRC